MKSTLSNSSMSLNVVVELFVVKPTHPLGGILDVITTRSNLPSSTVSINDVGQSDHHATRALWKSINTHLGCGRTKTTDVNNVGTFHCLFDVQIPVKSVATIDAPLPSFPLRRHHHRNAFRQVTVADVIDANCQLPDNINAVDPTPNNSNNNNNAHSLKAVATD
jgi:hypothetical protein